MYEISINVNKNIKLNTKQFTLLKLIGQLGFLNFTQLTLLWSVINQTYVGFSHSTIKRWISNYHLLKKRSITISKTKRSSNLSRPVYYISSVGVRMLQKYKVDYIPLQRLNFNAHNEQCNEVTVQTLFKAAFDIDLLNNPQLKPLDQQSKHLLASSNFNLDKLDLRQFAKQVPNYKRYPFVPDQMISFYLNGQKCEIMIELDNRTENDNVQMQKIFNYLLYANDQPDKRILMVIAITDGSLPNYRVPKYKPLYNKVNNLLNKFKKYTIDHNHKKFSLAKIYRKVNNLTITIAGVNEAHIDLADFISNKDYVHFSTITLKNMANLLTNRFQQKVTFQVNSKINAHHLNYLDKQGLTLGYMIYNPNPAIYQTIKLGYEHSLDTYLDLYECIPQNSIYSFPARARRLLTPSIPDYYQDHTGQSVFSHMQGMIFQPIIENSINPDLLLQLLFAKQNYYKYLYRFFTTGTISAKDTTNYNSLTYIRSTTYPLINLYLKKAHIQLQNVSPRSYQILNKIAEKTTSAKEFSKQIHIQDIPLEVISSIFKQIPIRASSSPYYSTSSSQPCFDPSKYLYLPDQTNPDKRTKITILAK